LNRLVYFERHEDISEAITREKQIKNWHRAYKIRLINSMNAEWNDLYPDICA
jgi:putative endonuclease